MATPATGRRERLSSLLSDMRYVSANFGKSYAKQLIELMRVRVGPGKVGASEYYFYRLFDDQHLAAADKKTFLGWRMQDRVDALTEKEWWISVEDKLLLYGYLSGLGFPIPRIYAIYHPFRTYTGATTLPDKKAVRVYLESSAQYPLFAKPNHAGCARGAVGIASCDIGTSTLVCTNDERVSVEEFLSQIQPFAEKGYIFQELLRASDALVPVTGPQLSSVRLVVVTLPTGPKLVRGAWRIPLAGNMADNFSQPGNMMAGIDLQSGRLTNVVRGTGTEQESHDVHPETGYPLRGYKLPSWPETVSLCLAAAATIPGVAVQGWDIAFSSKGPVVIEANITGDFDLPQAANGRGLLTEDFRQFLRTAGVL